ADHVKRARSYYEGDPLQRRSGPTTTKGEIIMRYLNRETAKPFSRWLSLVALLLLGLAPAWAQAPDEIPVPLQEWGETSDDIPDGYMIIEGYILVPIGFDQINAPPWATNLWPNGVVPYEFDTSVTADHRTAMLAAMAEWTAVANVTFRVRTN